MSVFQPIRLYSIDLEQAEVVAEYAPDITPLDDDMSMEEYQSGFWVRGVGERALALFAAVMNDEGVSEYAYLVAGTDRGCGLLASLEDVESGDYFTPELTRKLRSLPEEELAQFGIEAIVARARRK